MTKRTLLTAAFFSLFGLFVPVAAPSPVAELAILGPTVACAQDDDHIEIDKCFSGCHDHGMWRLTEDEDCDLSCASDWFEWCMEKFCGGM